jgi:hypothetical protein
MTVQEIIERLGLGVLSDANLFQEITGGYASDLLSCVMAKARAGNVWVTLQAHPNVVAVASLLDLAAVIVTEGVAPDAETIRKAQEEGIALLTTPSTTFAVVGGLTELGIRGTSAG